MSPKLTLTTLTESPYKTDSSMPRGYWEIRECFLKAHTVPIFPLARFFSQIYENSYPKHQVDLSDNNYQFVWGGEARKSSEDKEHAEGGLFFKHIFIYFH